MLNVTIIILMEAEPDTAGTYISPVPECVLLDECFAPEMDLTFELFPRDSLILHKSHPVAVESTVNKRLDPFVITADPKSRLGILTLAVVWAATCRGGCSNESDHARERASGEQPQRVPRLAQDEHYGE